MDSRLIIGAAGAAAVLALLGGALAGAQTPVPGGAPVATAAAPPPPSLGPIVAPPAAADADEASGGDDAVAERHAKIEVPEGPPRPERSPAAIIGVLDKVTAETVRFEAPVGKRVRYRGMIFDTRACETWDPHGPHPRPSAWLVVQSEAALDGGLEAPNVFEGWMFARAPAVHPFQHPVYDAWLEACTPAPAPSPPA